jgi:hypothetical protein
VTRGETFGDALTTLLELIHREREAFSGPDADGIEVSIFGPDPRAEIAHKRKTDAKPDVREYERPRKRAEDPPFADLQFIARFTQVTIGHVGSLVAESA